MAGDHEHCAKHPTRPMYTEVGEFRHPVCKECYEEMVWVRAENYRAQYGAKHVGWGGDD